MGVDHDDSGNGWVLRFGVGAEGWGLTIMMLRIGGCSGLGWVLRGGDRTL